MDLRLRDRVNDELTINLFAIVECRCDVGYKMTKSEVATLPALVHALQKQLENTVADAYRPKGLQELLTDEEIGKP